MRRHDRLHRGQGHHRVRDVDHPDHDHQDQEERPRPQQRHPLLRLQAARKVRIIEDYNGGNNLYDM